MKIILLENILKMIFLKAYQLPEAGLLRVWSPNKIQINIWKMIS